MLPGGLQRLRQFLGEAQARPGGHQRALQQVQGALPVGADGPGIHRQNKVLISIWSLVCCFSTDIIIITSNPPFVRRSGEISVIVLGRIEAAIVLYRCDEMRWRLATEETIAAIRKQIDEVRLVGTSPLRPRGLRWGHHTPHNHTTRAVLHGFLWGQHTQSPPMAVTQNP